jgi:thioredoxin 1
MRHFDWLPPEEFSTLVLDSPVPVLINFGAVWCPGCRLFDAALDVLRETFPRHLRIFRLNVSDPETILLRGERLWPLGASFSVNIIPVTLLFAGGRLVRTIHGPRPAAEVAEALRPYLSADAPDGPASSPTPVHIAHEGQVSGDSLELPLTVREIEAIDREQGVLAQVALRKGQRSAFGRAGPP